MTAEVAGMNKKLKCNILTVDKNMMRLPNIDTGVMPYIVSASCCRQLQDALMKLGLGHVAKLPMPNGKVFLLGYADYPLVNARKHVGTLQARKIMVARDNTAITACLQLPGFSKLLEANLQVLGLQKRESPHTLVQVHFIRQDEDMQSSFTWHSDEVDLPSFDSSRHTGRVRTMITQLSCEASSAMCMWNHKPHYFRGRGASAAFHGEALHASCVARPNTPDVYKVCMFFILPDAF